MARFMQFGDMHVRDTETYHELPINRCTLYCLSNVPGVYVATLDNVSAGAEVTFRVGPRGMRALHEGGLDRRRGIVIDFEYEECIYNPIPPYRNQHNAGLLVPHVVAVQIGFDPVIYEDGLPLFK